MTGSSRLEQRLQECSYLLADGATGTNLFEMGLTSGEAPELWNLHHPDRIARLHQAMADAGADIILTNSFGGNRYRLKLHGMQDEVGNLNLAAARIARQVADERGRVLGRPILVAGSIGPTGELFQPLGPLTVSGGAEAFAEQARALKAGGADIAWIETLSAKEEWQAAILGAQMADLPFVSTMSFDTNGRTMMGMKPEEFAALCHSVSPAPIAFGGNCGVGASELLAAILNMKKATTPEDILVAKGNCGIPQFQDGHIHYSGTPELMADYARLARDMGVRIIGGCCGTSPLHLKAMADALTGYTPGGEPDVETLISRLGPMSQGAHTLCGHMLEDTNLANDTSRRRLRRRGTS